MDRNKRNDASGTKDVILFNRLYEAGINSMDKQEIEAHIIELLRSGPMKQVDIVDALPLELYINVGRVIRDMDARGVVRREPCLPTKMVYLITDS